MQMSRVGLAKMDTGHCSLHSGTFCHAALMQHCCMTLQDQCSLRTARMCCLQGLHAHIGPTHDILAGILAANASATPHKSEAAYPRSSAFKMDLVHNLFAKQDDFDRSGMLFFTSPGPIDHKS